MQSYHHNIYWNGKSYTYDSFTSFIKEKNQLHKLEEWEKNVYIFTQEWLNTDKHHFEIQTSGSTGKAKTILLHRQDMVKSAIATGEYFQLKPKDTALLCLPAEYIAGKMMIVRALVLGLDLSIIKPSINALEKINQHYRFCALIPLQIQHAFQNLLYDKLNLINTMIIGGASLSTEYTNKLDDLETHAYATYGMTETITHIALQKLNGNDKKDYFTCLPGIQVAQDDRGRLVIKSNNRNKKEWKTNDLALILSPISFKILGRFDDIINSGGLKINPVEIEGEISQYIDMPFMIGYRFDKKLGQKLVLLVESNEPILKQENLLNQLKKHLSPNKAPKEITNIPKLFTTANNKLDRVKNNAFLK